MDLTDELTRLVDLHERGGLTDDEFLAAKRRVIDADAATSTASPAPELTERPPAVTRPAAQEPRPASSTAGLPPFAKPSTHMVWAVLSAIFCCLPLGVVAVVYAAQVNTKWATGDWIGAAESSERAKTWAQIALVTGILAIILYYLAGAWMSADGRTY
jgi:hypothetical protein